MFLLIIVVSLYSSFWSSCTDMEVEIEQEFKIQCTFASVLWYCTSETTQQQGCLGEFGGPVWNSKRVFKFIVIIFFSLWRHLNTNIRNQLFTSEQLFIHNLTWYNKKWLLHPLHDYFTTPVIPYYHDMSLLIVAIYTMSIFLLLGMTCYTGV